MENAELNEIESLDDENRTLKEQNEALLKRLNEKAALLHQKAVLEQETMRLQMMQSLGTMPDPWLLWSMQMAGALQQQQALLGFDPSQRSMPTLGDSGKKSGRNRTNTASTTCSFESGGRSNRFDSVCSLDEDG